MLVRTETFRFAQVAAADPPSILGTPSHINETTAADPQTATYTLESGADGLVVIVFSDSTGGVVTFDGVSWQATGASSQALSAGTARRTGTGSNDTRCQAFWLANPNVGSSAGQGTVSVDLSGALVIAYYIVSISGWSGDAPTEAGRAASTTDTDPAVLDITPTAPSLILHAVSVAANGTSVTFDGAEAGLLDAASANNTLRAAVSSKQVTEAGATTVDLSFSASPARYAEIAVAFPG